MTHCADEPGAVPFLPGPIGRTVRLVLGVLVVQSAWDSLAALVDGVGGLPDASDTGLVIAVGIGAWLTPNVYDIGLRRDLGWRWRIFVLAAIAAAGAVGLAFGAPGTGVAVATHIWIIATLGWLGISFVVAATLRTPGCEMRALPHLRSRLVGGGHDFVACPGQLQPLDEWEARTSGRAEPYSVIG